MNKAFVREPEADGRQACPICGSPGTPVGAGPLNTHVKVAFRSRLGDNAWYCSSPDCKVAYFDAFEQTILVQELQNPVYPYDLDAPVCRCFGLSFDDIDADARETVPVRIRALIARASSSEARCQTLSVDGQCCLREVQRLYLKLRGSA